MIENVKRIFELSFDSFDIKKEKFLMWIDYHVCKI